MKAMILAAGRGSRMRPLTDSMPKPLLEVGGRALIAWHLQRLAEAGFTDIVINHAWLGEQIEAALGDGARFGVRIRYSPERTALETAGGIHRALPLLCSDWDALSGDGVTGAGQANRQPFLVVNGDVWTDYPFAALRSCRPRSAHLVLVDNPAHNPGGDFGLEGRRIVAAEPRLTYAGLGVFAPVLFDSMSDGISPLKPILQQALAAGTLEGEHYRGRWVDVGTPQRLLELDRSVSD